MTLRKLRKVRGETQRQTAAAVGITQSWYSRLETGKALPSREVVIRLAVHFGVTTDEVLSVFREPTGSLSAADPGRRSRESWRNG